MFVSTPNVLTLAPKGAARSGNPWHVHEYRLEEFERLCRARFREVRMFGLFHARKLRVHELALRLGWDSLHPRLGLTSPFYGWFTPAIAVSDFALQAARPGADRDGARLPRRVPGLAMAAGTGASEAGGAAGEGALAIVLHTHMPYVEGFGTWPFGEEWLWEAIVGSYLPLLELLDAGAPLTLSLTPVLCDQLEAPGVAERFAGVRRARPPPHPRRGCGRAACRRPRAAGAGARTLVGGLRAGSAQRCDARGGGLLEAFAPHAQWTSSATHAVLPLLATDDGLRLQVQSGHRLASRSLRRRLARGLLAARVRSCAGGWSRCSPTRACTPRAWS